MNKKYQRETHSELLGTAQASWSFFLWKSFFWNWLVFLMIWRLGFPSFSFLLPIFLHVQRFITQRFGESPTLTWNIMNQGPARSLLFAFKVCHWRRVSHDTILICYSFPHADWLWVLNFLKLMFSFHLVLSAWKPIWLAPLTCAVDLANFFFFIPKNEFALGLFAFFF